MRNITPWLGFVLRLVLLVTVATHIDSCFHCAPHSLSTIRRKQPSQQRQQRLDIHDSPGSHDGKRNDLYYQNQKWKHHNHDRVNAGKLPLDRRSFLWVSPSALLGVSFSMLLGYPTVAKAALAGNEKDSDEKDRRLTDQIVKSLVFEKILGSGSYKTVYLVSASIPALKQNDNLDNTGSMRTIRYALAVERLRNKRDVKNAFRGVRIPDLIRQGLNDTNSDGELFETILDWWVQPSNVQEFAHGKRVFPAAAAVTKDGPVNIDKILGRTRSEPKKNFAGSRWMISLKPVYETDFKRFIRNAPVLFPIGKVGVDNSYEGKTSHDDKLLQASLSYYWTEPVLMAFILEMLHAGKLMHEASIVHRDIKPKNMMIYTVPLSSGSSIKRPVIIDYGFSEVGSPLLLEVGGQESKTRANISEKKTDICVVRPGQLKGEVDYVLAQDLANYRGCQRGDAYAMGKTLYEFIFGSAELQQKRQEEQEVISVDGAEIQNQKFWSLLFDDATAGTESRFRLSRDAADCLLSIARGLCGNQKDASNALSFAEAEDILSAFLSPTPSLANLEVTRQ